MYIPDEEIDAIVAGVLKDCAVVTPRLDRNEIAQHVLDQLSTELRKRVYASLDRMVGRGRIVRLSGGDGESWHRYDLPPGAGGCH